VTVSLTVPLAEQGIQTDATIKANLGTAALIEEALQRREGRLTKDGALLVDGALLLGGAALRDGAAAPGPDDCAEAAPAPKASKAATAAAVANFGTTRVMTKPRLKVRNCSTTPAFATQFLLCCVSRNLHRDALFRRVEGWTWLERGMATLPPGGWRYVRCCSIRGRR